MIAKYYFEQEGVILGLQEFFLFSDVKQNNKRRVYILKFIEII